MHRESMPEFREMTKKQALEETMELWNYTAENTPKSDTYESWKKKTAKALGMFDYAHQCPCCEYAAICANDVWPDCHFCPIWREKGKNIACEYHGEYGDWLRSPTKENALVIAYLAEEKLDDEEESL